MIFQRLKSALPAFVTAEQRGFVPGRLISANIVDLDAAMHEVRVRGRAGGMILVDFNAAFPSLSQKYMFSQLELIGEPGYIRQAMSHFYVNCMHDLILEGRLCPSFTARSGVRQGCPMSPSVYVMVTDMLVSMLVETLPNSVVIRAFADDIGIVTDDLYRYIPVMQGLFDQFRRIAGLCINPGKTVIVPAHPLLDISPVLRGTPWASVKVATMPRVSTWV